MKLKLNRLFNESADASAPENFSGGTATIAKPKNILVHTRNADDQKVLTENFDISKIGNARFVTGLQTDAQTALVKAAAKGTQIVTTGLPLDIAASLGEVTVLRAWNKTREDGTKTQGSTPPADYFAGKIVDPAAFAELKASPAFAKAFNTDDDTPEDEAEVPGF